MQWGKLVRWLGFKPLTGLQDKKGLRPWVVLETAEKVHSCINTQILRCTQNDNLISLRITVLF